MPFKVFSTAVVPASEMNDYLMEQCVIQCTSATRPSSPNEGMTIYETDTDRFLVHDGTTWQRAIALSASARTGCVLQRAAVQSINDATETTVSWDSEVTDSDGFITAPSGTITIPSGLGGLYAVTARTDWSSNVLAAYNGTAFMKLTAGGIIWNQDLRGGASACTVLLSLPAVRLAAGQTAVLSVYQSSGGARNVTGYLEMWRLSL